MNGKVVNYSKIARQVGVSYNTIKSYYEILEDTLMGFHVPAYHRSVRKQQISSPKFYYIDPGIRNALMKTLEARILPATSSYGAAFEHFIVCEIYKYLKVQRPDYELSFLTTKDDAEIDLIITRHSRPPVLIEIKSKEQVFAEDARHLRHFRKDFDSQLGPAKCLIISRDKAPKDFGGIRAIYFEDMLGEFD